MFGSSHFGYFGRSSDKLSPWRRTVRSSFKRPFGGRTAYFTCEMTGEVISPLDCRECNHYTLIEGEVDLRTCHYRSPEQIEVEQENRRKTEEEIRRNEEISRELDEEMSRLKDRQRSIEEDWERMHEWETEEKEEIGMLEEDHQEEDDSIREENDENEQ
jgi:hypothetical protein